MNGGPAMGERLGNDFEGDKKLFWKEIKQVRKGEQAREEMVKDVNGQILHDGIEVRRRWAEYFEPFLNVADVREANINVVGNWWMPVLGDLNERAISLEEVGEEVNEMKSGKAPGLDGFTVECIKKGSMAVLEWLGRPCQSYGLAWCLYSAHVKKGRVTNVNVATLEVLVC